MQARLRALLTAYAGSRGIGAGLRRAAAAAILREDPRMELPPWLVELFQVRACLCVCVRAYACRSVGACRCACALMGVGMRVGVGVQAWE